MVFRVSDVLHCHFWLMRSAEATEEPPDRRYRHATKTNTHLGTHAAHYRLNLHGKTELLSVRVSVRPRFPKCIDVEKNQRRRKAERQVGEKATVHLLSLSLSLCARARECVIKLTILKQLNCSDFRCTSAFRVFYFSFFIFKL